MHLCFCRLSSRTQRRLSLLLFWGALGMAPFATGAQPGSPPSLKLTLDEAIQLALKNNVQSQLARERIIEAQGQSGIARSALLPNLYGAAFQANVTANLAALGLTPGKIPGLHPFVGPFNRFDARLQLVQSVFNLPAIRRYQAAMRGLCLTRLGQRSVEQQLTLATALAYLAALEAEQSVQAAQADVELAERLLELARHGKEVGVATGVDVARAETHLAAQQVRLAQAKTDRETARLNLLRVIGAPLESQLELADQLRYQPEPLPAAEEAVQRALTQRVEIHMAEEQVRIARLQKQAAATSLLPSVSLFGDYGGSGITLVETNLPTRTVGVRLDLPVFAGGRIRSEIQVASSQLRQAEMKLQDLRAEVEKQVREALENLRTRREQVEAAQRALQLAQRELELAQDRFVNGLANNIEVLNAQAALENARKGWIDSLALYNIARLNLAMALGRVEDFRL